MKTNPRTTAEIYESMRDSLTGKIAKLSNFTDRSFNAIFTSAFAQQVRELELLAKVSEISGWIDYTGGPVSESDLEDLGIEEEVSVDEINELMNDNYLDEYVKIVGISRFPGARATGTVTFQTQSAQTEIPSGTKVTTTPESDGTTTDFLTTDLVETAEGVTTVSDVPIQAEEVGTEYNLPADTIIRLADPPIGVKGVTNPESTTGGEEQESNEDLRARAKTAVQSSSLGGTTDGIKGYIRQNVEGVGQGDIIIDESTDTSPIYVDVIVDGGLDDKVIDAINFSRPTGVLHNLIRPQIIQLGFDVDLRGVDINTSTVHDNITNYLLDLGLSGNYYEDELISIVMNSDEDIVNIDNLGGVIERVTNEVFTYQTGTTDYRLDFTYEDEHGSITVEDEDGVTYTQGNDYEVQDQTGDGWPETLVWIGATPDDGVKFIVDYDVTVPGSTSNGDRYLTTLVRDEVFNWNEGETDQFQYNTDDPKYFLDYVPFDGTVSISDESGDSYTEGVDYKVIDDTGNTFKQTVDWSDIPLDGAVADDGGTTADETTAANNDTSDDMTLLPDSPATGDAYYFGFNQEFDDIRLDISTAGSGTWDVVWEYYNGTSWVSLSGVSDGTNDFRNSGVNEISWTVPGDWATTSVGGISGLYWVRGRLDTFTSISTQPLGRRADQNETPDGNEDFTVTYDQKLFHTKYEHRDTPQGEIRDSDGDIYEQNVDYVTAEYEVDSEKDSIEWLTNPSTISDGDEFYFTYFGEGDIYFGDREKADPGAINVTTI